MKNVLVLFSCVSEEYIYREILESLKGNYIVDFDVINPLADTSRLKEKVSSANFDLVLTGGGLSALLPALCTTLSDRPVFGVPIPTHFGGLDSLLSMIQMPQGSPVGTFAHKNMQHLISFLSEVKQKSSKKVNVVVSRDIENYEFFNQEYSALSKMSDDLGIELTKSNSIESELMNIVLVHSDYNHQPSSNALYVPLLASSDKHSPPFAIKLLDLVSIGGIWFGVNSSRNALLFLNKFLI